ncbi:MAG: DUF1538 domain-containing protein [Acidaminococcaceae bacterium]|nr:DUF1538 domain-containing protein [Acidaminococcaceae bacterium]MBP3811805.1 DUF1538 domain-containing protein [Acidaminococcaceae bacterium]
MFKEIVKEKFSEVINAIVPVVAIVLLLSVTLVPMPTHVVMVFFYGCILLMIGMVFFTIGSEQAMEPMGKYVGARITKTRKLWLILPLGFLLGFMITVSEPDLQVLANQVQSIPNSVLVLSVSGGVAFFLVLALVRMVLGIPLQRMLVFFYLIAFGMAFFAPPDFLAVAFDSGGVTTGPMTVPFIMAFGIGVSALRGTKHSSQDSFGLIALCSIGPIIAVLLLSLIFRPENAVFQPITVPKVLHSLQLSGMFLAELPEYMEDLAQAIVPIAVFFGIFQFIALHLEKKALLRIVNGIVYTYVGLVLFLTGANVGFIPAGFDLGSILATLPYNWIIIPIGMLIGYFIIKAEPAVYVLMKQVEDITAGAISGQALQRSLSIGVSVSVGLAMVRVLTGIHLFYMLIPGYAIAIALSFIVPPVFTAIAFDSGGVASGPMTATFLLPFAMGACMTVGGNVVTDAFGVVTMVAMTPLIAIQCLGLVYMLKESRAPKPEVAADTLAGYGDYDIIDL